MYMRNNDDIISYADSIDNGINWGTCISENNLNYASDVMISATNIDGFIRNTTTNEKYENLVVMSYPLSNHNENMGRYDGVIRLGTSNGNTVTWLNNSNINYSGYFGYSNIIFIKSTTNTNEGKLAILYENSQSEIKFDILNIEDLLPSNMKYNKNEVNTYKTTKDTKINVFTFAK